MMFQRWLIRLLGGFTSEEANKACNIVQSMTEIKMNLQHAENLRQVGAMLAEPEKPVVKPAVH